MRSLDDLTPALARYRALLAAGRGEEALEHFRRHLAPPLIHPLGAFDLKVELLEELAAAGAGGEPPLAAAGDRAAFLLELGHGYLSASRPADALAPLARALEAGDGLLEPMRHACGLGWLAKARRLTGELEGATAAARAAVERARRLDKPSLHAYLLHFLGLALGARGLAEEAEAALRQGLRTFEELDAPQEQGVLWACLAQAALWAGDAEAARTAAAAARRLAAHEQVEDDFVRAARLEGCAALAGGDLDTAGDRLAEALERARRTGFLQEEIQAAVAAAELARRRGRPAAGEEDLAAAERAAARAPFRLEAADAADVRARRARDAGDRPVAVAAARRAYELAWCDGPAASYRAGLDAAARLLEELGAAPPDLAAAGRPRPNASR